MADTNLETKPAAEATPAPAPAAAAPAPAVETTKPETLLAAAPVAEPAKPAEPAPAAAEPAKPAEAPTAQAAVQAEAAKPADPTKDPTILGKEPEAPVVYDIKLPEGLSKDQFPGMSDFTNILGEHKISAETGQALFDLYAREVQALPAAIEKAQADQWSATQKEWQDAVRADPEIGGNRMETALRQATSVIEQFGGTPEEKKALRTALNLTGAGNHPTIIRFLSRVGKGLAEPLPVPAQNPKPAPGPGRTRAERRYNSGT